MDLVGLVKWIVLQIDECNKYPPDHQHALELHVLQQPTMMAALPTILMAALPSMMALPAQILAVLRMFACAIKYMLNENTCAYCEIHAQCEYMRTLSNTSSMRMHAHAAKNMLNENTYAHCQKHVQ